MRLPRQFGIRVARLIIGTVAICLFGMPASDATASCGDYLHHSDQSSRTETVARKDRPPQRPSRPCNGPICGKAPPAPATTTPAVTPSRPDNNLSVEAPLCSTERKGSRRHRFEPPTLLPAGHPLAIDRPPRRLR